MHRAKRSQPVAQAPPPAGASPLFASGVTALVACSRALALVTLAVLALAGLVGCVSLSASDASPLEASSAPTAERPAHDVAVLSVDFDPPLGSLAFSSQGNSATGADVGMPQSLALLVAVDNRGAQAETGLVVVVQLTTDEPTDAPRELREPVGALAPGEVKVVRLSRGADVPLRPSYWLTVQVVPVEGEVNLANNARTLRIHAQTTVRRS